MTRKREAETARRRGIPVVLKVLVLCLIAFIVLLLLLPEPPLQEGGGMTAVNRRMPALRGTVNPLAKTQSSEEPLPRSALKRNTVRQIQPGETPQRESGTQAAPPAPVKKRIRPPPAEPRVARLPAPTAPAGVSALPSKSDLVGWLK